VGDATHASSPHFGADAGIGVGDSRVLSISVHGRVPHMCASHERASHRCTSHEDTLYGRVSHGRVPYRRRLHLIGVYLTGVHPMSVYLINVHLTGVHLTGVHLMGVYLMGVHLIGVYFMDVYMFPNPKGLWAKSPDPPPYKRRSICRDMSCKMRVFARSPIGRRSHHMRFDLGMLAEQIPWRKAAGSVGTRLQVTQSHAIDDGSTEKAPRLIELRL
jgi:hypothetical protein